MTITVVRVAHSDPLITNADFISVTVTSEDTALFETLISRGANTWDRAPARIKIAADEIRYGKAKQDYNAQAGTKPRSE